MFTSSGTGTSDTKITATFKDSDATIVASGETVELFLTGIKNPASTKAQLNFKVTTTNSDASETEFIPNVLTGVGSLETCVYES